MINTKPEWLQSYIPDASKKKAGNPNWKPGCKSPNSSGRPKKLQDKRTRVTEKLLDEAQKVLDVVIEKAKGGDMQAASLILGRTTPTLKANAQKVSFNFDAAAPMVEQVQNVIQAICDGEISADIGRQVIESIGVLDAIRQAESLKERLDALESQA